MFNRRLSKNGKYLDRSNCKNVIKKLFPIVLRKGRECNACGSNVYNACLYCFIKVFQWKPLIVHSQNWTRNRHLMGLVRQPTLAPIIFSFYFFFSLSFSSTYVDWIVVLYGIRLNGLYQVFSVSWLHVQCLFHTWTKQTWNSTGQKMNGGSVYIWKPFRRINLFPADDTLERSVWINSQVAHIKRLHNENDLKWFELSAQTQWTAVIKVLTLTEF